MMTGEEVRRGCIYLVDLCLGDVAESGPQGAAQGRRRPALVVQNDLGNLSSDTTIVVALSSRMPSRAYPFHVVLPADILGKPGIIMCEQIWTVSRRRVDPQALAECSADLMEQVEEALRHSLGLSAETGEHYVS